MVHEYTMHLRVILLHILIASPLSKWCIAEVLFRYMYQIFMVYKVHASPTLYGNLATQHFKRSDEIMLWNDL